jgi:hypothetical protein
MRAPRIGTAAWQLAQCAAITRATSHGNGELLAGAAGAAPPASPPAVPALETPLVSGAPTLAMTGGELAAAPPVPCETPDVPGAAFCAQPHAIASKRSDPTDPNHLSCRIFVSSIRARAIGLLRLGYERDLENDHAAFTNPSIDSGAARRAGVSGQARLDCFGCRRPTTMSS